MRRQTVFMFSGQGSQYFQMARALFENNQTFGYWLRKMDGIVRDLTGKLVLPVLYGERGMSIPFVDITMTHPAIFMVEYALARTLMANGVMPDYTLGASLGSFAAASISGCLPMEDALTLVVKQADLVQANCEQGGMIAILADQGILAHAPWKNQCEIASINFESHFVVSASAKNLLAIEQWLRAQGKAFQTLPVSFAFHSSSIDPARNAFLGAVAECVMTETGIPLTCCATMESLSILPSEFFWTAVRAPIQFQQSVLKFETEGSFNYLDLGPSGTLATFLKYLLPASSESTARAVITPYGREREALAAITGRASL